MKFKEWLIKESAEDLLQNAEKLADMSCDDVEELLRQGGGFSDWDDRAKFTSKYSWSIPCKDAIDAIKKWARPPLYDLMAGTGFWSKILNERGVSTIASDIHKFSKFNLYHKEHIKKHYKIRRRHALKAVRDIERARETQEIVGDILLGWPPYLETTAFEVLSRLPIGVRVFYFGEGSFGATGDLAMHTSFDRNFEELDHIYMPNFSGIHDKLVIYEKIKDEEIDPKFKGKTGPWDLDDNE